MARLRKNPHDGDAHARLRAVEALETFYGERVIPIDLRVMATWSRLLGAKQKNKVDLVLAATAQVHGLVVATRNVKDFVGKGVDVIDPFHDPPRIHASTAG